MLKRHFLLNISALVRGDKEDRWLHRYGKNRNIKRGGIRESEIQGYRDMKINYIER